MAFGSGVERHDAMRMALMERDLQVPRARQAPLFSHYIAKKLNVVLPIDDLQLWLDLAAARRRRAFLEVYRGREPTTERERSEIETTLHELCADTGYKATIYKGSVSGLYIWQIRRYKYPSAAKRRETLRRKLNSGEVTAEMIASAVRPSSVPQTAF